MGRYKIKDSHPITLRMEQELYDRLVAFCEESGQSKTTAVERAVRDYLKKYEDERVLLENATLS